MGKDGICSCVATYNATWGVIVEMKFNSEQGVRYFRADAPDDHVKDALSIPHEKALGDQVATPEDFYNKIQSVPPTVSKVIHSVYHITPLRTTHHSTNSVPIGHSAFCR